jgi:hypothetical protein
MTSVETMKSRKKFYELRGQIDAEPARHTKVEEYKTAMLGELRHAAKVPIAATHC